jgi:hypothetical protein
MPETLYLIPDNCPQEARIQDLDNIWDLGTIKQRIFDMISHRIGFPKELNIRYSKDLFLCWTCAGCADTSCTFRRVSIGGICDFRERIKDG